MRDVVGSRSYSSNRSLDPSDLRGAIERSGGCNGLPASRKRLTIG